MNFSYHLTLILSYSIPKFVKIECHLHGHKNRSTFAQWPGGGGVVVATPSTLHLSNFRAKTVRSDLKNFFMDRCPKDEPTAKTDLLSKSSW